MEEPKTTEPRKSHCSSLETASPCHVKWFNPSGSVHDGSAACTAEPIRKAFVPVARCTWFETDGIKLRTALRPQTSLP